MNPSTPSFYVTGGTLRHDTPSYVERQADQDLYAGLQAGEFCYVLTSRQMGKSSLMVRTAARLRAEGVQVVALDLTAVGQNVSAEQWYYGLLGYLGVRLDLEDELEDFWEEHDLLGPLQRWMGALREVVLPRLSVKRSALSVEGTDATPQASTLNAQRSPRLVIFIDEIDCVRSLPFSTDEFFAAIRECYNRRTEDPEYERLTFCLLGVASPSDLIQDTRITPFNIGRRIELTDFTAAEAAPFRPGLVLGSAEMSGRSEGQARALLDRVLYWTGGHPYLTQRLCRAVADDASVKGKAGVDRHCEALFLSAGAQERDDNLIFVRELLLNNEADRASVLDLYGKVRSGTRVRPDDTDPLIDLLRLSGITRLAETRSSTPYPRRPTPSLVVRNRIYERIFDRRWVTEHMPDAELRRQQAAFRRGVLRASALAAVVLVLVAGLALIAVKNAHRAERLGETLRGNLYAAQMKLAQQALDEGNLGYVRELVEAYRHPGSKPDLRGFEWRYLWRQCQGDELFTLRGHTGRVFSVVFSPDGKTLASSSYDGTIKLWNRATRQQVASLRAAASRAAAHETAAPTSLAFSPDGQTLAAGDHDHTVKLWDVLSRRQIGVLTGHTDQVFSVAFSPNGQILASKSLDGEIRVWDTRTRRTIGISKGWHPGGINALAFSPDGRLLASGSENNTVKLWEVPTQRVVAVLRGHEAGVWPVAFSPDGRILATGDDNGTIKLWDVALQRNMATLPAHKAGVVSLAFSPDGKTLASSSEDTTVKYWRVGSAASAASEAVREVATLRGHAGEVLTVRFSPDGKIAATASVDGTIKLWDVSSRQAGDTFRVAGSGLPALLSAAGQLFALDHPDGNAKLGTAKRRGSPSRAKGDLKAPLADVVSGYHRSASLAVSRDGKTLAVGHTDGTVTLWDVTSQRPIATLAGHPRAVQAVAFSPDGKTLASSCQGPERNPLVYELKLWDLASRRAVATLTAGGSVISLAFSPDGKTLAAGHWPYPSGETVDLWDIASRRKVATLAGQLDGLPCVAFSPDGKLLASGSWDKYVTLWDLASRRKVVTLKGHRNTVVAVAFSPDGKTLASASMDRTVRLWNLACRQEVATLTGGGAGRLAFSPDGSMLTLMSDDGTIRLWRAASFAETDGRQERSLGK